MIALSTGRVRYHFATTTLANNFKRDRAAHRSQLEASLTKRFKLRVNVTQDFADLVLYHRTNSGLFLVDFGEKSYSNMQDIISEIGVLNI